jgi:hypothetical protein
MSEACLSHSYHESLLSVSCSMPEMFMLMLLMFEAESCMPHAHASTLPCFTMFSCLMEFMLMPLFECFHAHAVLDAS